MGSLTKTYSHQKLHGKVYTPIIVVEKILNDCRYNNEKILGKSILDPSCGDGRFLTIVAKRIIHFSSKQNLKSNLEKIYGWDIDASAIEECLKNLNTLIENHGISVDWNIKNTDSLRKITDKFNQKFDYIVGNPPYIRIQHLNENDRKFIQNNYKFCKSGSTDTYIAFFELCDKLLEKDGVCGLITPNTFFYNETAYLLRQYFSSKKNLIKISNYADIQLFENATTYSAITIFGKNKKDSFIYEHAKDFNKSVSRHIDFNEIRDEKFWQLTADKYKENGGIKLKDICNVHVGITTLCDKAYIFTTSEVYKDKNLLTAHTYYKGDILIEKSILKPIIKASRLKSSNDKIYESILFPYMKINDKNKIIPEEILIKEYPLAYEYLLSIKNTLDMRDNGKPNAVAWYAFGRSQGLDTSFGKKILFSPMNLEPNFILTKDTESTFYSGYCIKYNGDYNFLLAQLNSQRFADFINISSRDFRGGWKAYNKKVLQEFKIIPTPNTHKIRTISETSNNNITLDFFV